MASKVGRNDHLGNIDRRAAGLAMGGLYGLLGAAAGLFAEQQIRRQTDPEQARKVAFTVAVIALSAKMAKADGMVTQAEIEAFRSRVDIPQRYAERVGKFGSCQTNPGWLCCLCLANG